MYDGTKPNISQDMLAFEASIRENFDAVRIGDSSFWSTSSFLQTAIYTGGGTAVGFGALPQPYTRVLVNVAPDKNLWVRNNTDLTIEAANNAGSANVPLRLQASQLQVLGGNVGIGGPPSYRLHVITDGTPVPIAWKRDGASASKLWALQTDSLGTYLGNLTDAVYPLHILNSGDVGIGGTPGAGVKLDVVNTGGTSLYIRAWSNGSAAAGVAATAGNGTTSSRVAGFLATAYEASSRQWYLGMDGTHDFVFRDLTNSATRMMISANGLVGIASTPDAGYLLDVNTTGGYVMRLYAITSGFKKGLELGWVGGSEENRILSYDRTSGQYQHLTLAAYNTAFTNPNGVLPTYGGGVGVRFYANAQTVPSSNPTNGALHWIENGASKARGSSGTVTTYAPADPHCPVCGGDFVLEQYNDITGRYLSVCWDCWAEEKGERHWIVRRSRTPVSAFRTEEILQRKQLRDAEADALIAPPLLAVPSQPGIALPPIQTEPSSGPVVPPIHPLPPTTEPLSLQ